MGSSPAATAPLQMEREPKLGVNALLHFQGLFESRLHYAWGDSLLVLFEAFFSPLICYPVVLPFKREKQNGSAPRTSYCFLNSFTVLLGLLAGGGEKLYSLLQAPLPSGPFSS